MGSAAEREVPVRTPIEPHLVGTVELRVVSVRGADEQRRAVAGFHSHAADLDVLGNDARHHHHRCLVSQQLLDRGRNQRWVVRDRLAAFGMFGQVHDHAVECRRHGVEAAQEEQVARAEQLGVGHRSSVYLAVHQPAQEPVIGIGAALLDRVDEVLLDGAARPLADSIGLLHRRRLRADRVVAPLEELRKVAVREP